MNVSAIKKLGIILYLLSLCAYLYFPIRSALGDKLFTLVAILVLAEAIIMILEGIVSAHVKDKRRNYEVRRIGAYVAYAIALFLMAFVLIENPEALAVTFGLIATGLVVVFQDFILSAAAFVYISAAKPFKVGDRIEIGETAGDVIDSGPLFITLLEIKNWVKGDQATGRIVLVPNNFILKKQLNNYTKGFTFIWDELSIPITYDSNWRKARKIMIDAAQAVETPIDDLAKKQIDELENKYFFERRNIVPTVYTTPTDNWIRLDLRYIVESRKRRDMYNALINDILDRFEKEKDITIASQTLKLVK